MDHESDAIFRLTEYTDRDVNSDASNEYDFLE